MFFQRIRQTFSASLDRFADQIENHDAVTEAYLKRLQGDLKTLQVRLQRLNREKDQLTQRKETLQEQNSTWRQRATREQEEDRALECLRRAKQCEKEISHLDLQLKELSSLDQQLNRDLGTMKSEVSSLKGKRQALKAREARAHALEGFQKMDEHLSDGMDRCLERWEDRLLERELSAEHPCPDSFEEELQGQEEREELLLELQILREEGTQA